MKSVLQAANEPITVHELFVRTMRLMNETGDADNIARMCGVEPDDIVYQGENFSPAIKLVN
jgi:hypothetical protein